MLIVIEIEFSKIVGIVAGVFTAASLLPQVFKSIKEKTAELSVVMMLLLFGGNSLWVWYGILKNDWPIIATNSFSFLLNTVMMILKFKYRRNG